MGFILNNMADYNLDAGVNAAAAQRAAGTNLLAGQDVKTSDFLNKYTDLINNQGTTEALAGRIGAELNLPNLQKSAFDLNQQVLDIPGTYKTGTRGFDVNANQLGRIIATKQAELAPLAQRATSQAQFAQEQLGTRLGYAQNDWNRQLLPLTSEQAFLTDRLARETSMFTEANQNELNAILDKIKNGIEIDQREKDRAQELAIAEKRYENELKLQQEKNNAPTPVSVGQGIWNPGSNSWDVRPPLWSFYSSTGK